MKTKNKKQIKNSLKKVNVFKEMFTKEIKKAYGNEENVVLEKCNTTINVDNIGECNIYIVYDENENNYNKTFRLAVQEYEKDSKSMMKVVDIFEI